MPQFIRCTYNASIDSERLHAAPGISDPTACVVGVCVTSSHCVPGGCCGTQRKAGLLQLQSTTTGRFEHRIERIQILSCHPTIWISSSKAVFALIRGLMLPQARTGNSPQSPRQRPFVGARAARSRGPIEISSHLHLSQLGFLCAGADGSARASMVVRT